jgi:hypothetical protein
VIQAVGRRQPERRDAPIPTPGAAESRTGVISLYREVGARSVHSGAAGFCNMVEIPSGFISFILGGEKDSISITSAASADSIGSSCSADRL